LLNQRYLHNPLRLLKGKSLILCFHDMMYIFLLPLFVKSLQKYLLKFYYLYDKYFKSLIQSYRGYLYNKIYILKYLFHICKIDIELLCVNSC